MKGIFYAGTSGFSYDHWGDGIFYPEDLSKREWLEYYCRFFSSLELNVTFYGLPKKETFAKWRERTGQEFTFSIKGSRIITHLKRLNNVKDILKQFFINSEGLSDKLRVILWQLPPGLHGNRERLKNFLSELSGYELRQAFEFRDTTWFTDDTYELLEEYNASLCIAHSKYQPSVERITADWIYLRFHGGAALYASNYSESELRAWAERIKVWLKQGKDVYAYFNNDYGGFAIKNGLLLKELVLSPSYY